jgi:hypothetical protein
MNKPLHASEDRLMDLINGLLPSGDEQSIMAHLSECGPCEERFRALLRDHETARTTPSPSARADGSILPPRSSRRLRPAGVLVAAALLIALSAWLLSRDSGPDAYWIPMELGESTLRSADSVAVGSSEVFRAYENEDAQATIELLRGRPLPDDEMLASLQRLMLASAYVNTGQPREALDVIDKLEVYSLPVKWRQHGRWVEYLALRDAGQLVEARARLDVLVEDTGDVGVRARRELERLNAS